MARFCKPASRERRCMMQAMAPVLDLETGASRKAVIQFSDRFDVEPYRSLCGRTRRWATAAGYTYHAETARGLPTYSVYWEKVRMGLEALERGVEWALWVDETRCPASRPSHGVHMGCCGT